MANLKDQHKKLFRVEIAAKTMEYLMGMDEKNQRAVRCLAEKSSRKIVKAYYSAIKSQHKRVLKETAKKGKDVEVLPIKERVAVEQTNLTAS